MSKKIDLNADIGELEGEDGRALDARILDVVSSCNIACGGHAGDEESMRQTIRTAKLKGVSIGVHPSYPDRDNFGRVSMDISRNALAESLAHQIDIFRRVADEEGAQIAFLKAHGALYNDAAKDETLARLVCEVTRKAGIPAVVSLPRSAVSQVAPDFDLDVIAEGFADRAYEADGSLRLRKLEGAVLYTKSDQIAQAEALVVGEIRSFSGEPLSLSVQTICVHGDTPGAAETAAAIRNALTANGVQIAAV